MNNDIRLLLVDGHALVHRAYHAIPTLSTASGELTNAVFGFSNILLKEINELKPTHVIMALDRAAPTFRHQEFAEYKATRPRTAPELIGQFHRVREVAHAMNIVMHERDGFEADDVLGTLAKQAEDRGIETVILTGDLDALQLVSEHVRVLTPARGAGETTLYDQAAVRSRYGLEPTQIPDWKALVGDKSDNIPGVNGFGKKAAEELLSEYGSIENLLDHLSELPARRREALEPYREQVVQSKRLATIVRDVPETLDLQHCAWHDVDRTELIKLFRDLEFRSLIDRIQGMIPHGLPAANSQPTTPTGPQQLSMFASGEGGIDGVDQGTSTFDDVLPLSRQIEVTTNTRIVQEDSDLAELLVELRTSGAFALDTETTSTDPLRAQLVGLSFATRADHAWYLPVGHREGRQLDLQYSLDALRPLLQDPAVPKIAHNIKYDYAVLATHGIRLRGMDFDTMVMAYLIDPTSRGLSLKSLSLSKFMIEMTPIEALIGKGKSQITMAEVDIGTAALYAGADADITLRLKDALWPELVERELVDLFGEVEMPLVRVLADMEMAGVALDPSVLATMSVEMGELIGRLEGQIYETAGRPFNINSTQQLGQLLFRELKLPSGRRTKTGYSTDNEVLERLRGKHEIVDAILEYRQLIKLKNTYVDALPTLVNPDTGRVHTDFNQCVAATGRLSSSNPNLQNIPIRGDLGRTIRRAFVPTGAENVLLAVDYSQIELRILASMSGDERLLHAFLTGEDIHRATAAAVFGVPLEAVTPDQRRIAKVVNFGIIYGIGENRLAYETGISRAEAAEFITSYNRTYAGVKAFMDDMRKRAALYGYVSTLLNRRRYLQEIHSPNPGIRTAAERAAINMPIQGTAADIIKLAMVRLHRELAERCPDTRMLLQVHDELVFDVPRRDLGAVAPLVQDAMENALKLAVPLEVEMKVGRDWYDMAPLKLAP